MKTQDLLISLNYYVLNATKAAGYLSTQPNADSLKVKRVENLLKTAKDLLDTPSKPEEESLSLDFSEAKERSIAPQMLDFLMVLGELLVGAAIVMMAAAGFSIAADKLTEIYRGNKND